MPQIVPKSDAPRVDFCGVDDYYYIVRSDLGCYMKSSTFSDGNDLEVLQLHNSCQGGDHYFAHEDGYYYIVKGDDYRRVANMNKDDDAVVHSLHPNCRGGEHYLSAFGVFCIIFQDKGFYRRVAHLNTAKDLFEYALHPECKDGLYYWGTKNSFCFIKPNAESETLYCSSTNLHENLNDVIIGNSTMPLGQKASWVTFSAQVHSPTAGVL